LLKLIEEIELEVVHGTDLDPDGDKLCVFVHTVMNI
jgi:hypothetical protein